MGIENISGLRNFVAVAVLAFTLAGCGGSGGSSNTTTTPNPGSTNPPAPTGTGINAYPTSGRHVTPKIIFNAAGAGLAVWESADGPIYETNSIGRAIWYSLYKNGVWSKEAILQTIPDSGSKSGGNTGYFQLQAAASATGFAVVWIQQDRNNNNTTYYDTNLYARVFDGTNWGSVTSMESSTNPANHPAIASNGSGYLVVWEQFNSSSSLDAINGNTYSGGSWQGVSQIYSPATSINALNSPRVVSNGSGYATAWNEYSTSGYITSARIFNGSWGTSQSFTGLTGSSGSPLLESSGGNYMLIWNQSGGTSSALYSTSSATTWAAAAGASLPNLSGLKASNGGYAATYPCTLGTANTGLCANVYASGTWGSQVVVGNVASGNASNTVLASDGTGYAVLWRQYNATTSDYNVYYNTFTSTTAGTPIQVATTKSAMESNGSISPTSFPREAITYDGTGYMLGWIQCLVATGISSNEQVYAQHYSGTTAGTSSTLTSLVHDSGVHYPKLTINNAGIKLATWQQYYFDTSSGVPTYLYGLFAAATNVNGIWGAPMLLSPYGANAKVISNGTSFAIVYNSSSLYVAVRTYNDGNNATLSSQKSQSISIGYDPAITSNGTGYLMSWWETGTYPIYASIYNGTSWSSPASIGGSYGYGTPYVASNGNGYAVAWQHYDSTTTTNHNYANVFDGTSWLGAQQIDTQSMTMVPIPSTSSPHIASNGSNYAVVWRQNSGTYNSNYSSIFSGTSWSTPAVIDAQTANVLYPEVISNGTSYMSVWQDGTRCYARLWSAGNWGTLADLGTCPGAYTANESNMRMATDGTGYAFAFGTGNTTSYGLYAAAYSNGTWGPITGVMANNCGAPTSPDTAVLRGGSGGYGVLALCNGGVYNSFDLYGSFFHGSGWSTSALMENGAYPVTYGIDLAASGTSFTAVWSQPHESQLDPSAKELYMLGGL